MIELCTSFRECTISLLVSCKCMDTDNAYDGVYIIEYFINRLTLVSLGVPHLMKCCVPIMRTKFRKCDGTLHV